MRFARCCFCFELFVWTGSSFCCGSFAVCLWYFTNVCIFSFSLFFPSSRRFLNGTDLPSGGGSRLPGERRRPVPVRCAFPRGTARGCVPRPPTSALPGPSLLPGTPHPSEAPRATSWRNEGEEFSVQHWSGEKENPRVRSPAPRPDRGEPGAAGACGSFYCP